MTLTWKKHLTEFSVSEVYLTVLPLSFTRPPYELQDRIILASALRSAVARLRPGLMSSSPGYILFMYRVPSSPAASHICFWGPSVPQHERKSHQISRVVPWCFCACLCIEDSEHINGFGPVLPHHRWSQLPYPRSVCLYFLSELRSPSKRDRRLVLP